MLILEGRVVGGLPNSELRLTSGFREVFLEWSGRKIWVKPEPRAELYIPCYTPRRLKGGECNVARREAEW